MIAHTAVPSPQTQSPALAAWPSRPLGRIARWLQAEPRDVLIFVRTAGEGDQRTAPLSAETLSGLLDTWRVKVERRRLLVVARRWLLVALIGAAALVLLARLLGAPPLLGVAAPVLALAIVIALMCRPLSAAALARLLDRRLALKEQLATALERAERPAPVDAGSLAARQERRAIAALEEATHAWTTRAAPAGWEWAALGGAALALLLACVFPRSTAITVRPRILPSHAVAVLTPVAQGAAYVPALPPVATRQSEHALQMRIAVIRAPAAPTTVAASRTRTHAQVQTLRARTRLDGAASRSGAKVGATTAGANGSPAPGVAGHGGSPASSRPAPPGVAGRQTPLPVLSDRHLFLGTRQVGSATAGTAGPSSGSGAASRAGATSGNTRGIASRSVNAQGAQQTRRGANGKVGGHGGVSGTGTRVGGVAPGQIRVPYGGGVPANGQLPKPGLINGKSTFSGRVPDGRSTAGSGRGATTGRASSTTPPLSQGKQMTLQSAYGAARAAQGKRTSGMSGADNGQPYGAGGAGGGGGTIDYIPPDANAIAPDDATILVRYFQPAPTQ